MMSAFSAMVVGALDLPGEPVVYDGDDGVRRAATPGAWPAISEGDRGRC